jgi:signal transduction histidine kinase
VGVERTESGQLRRLQAVTDAALEHLELDELLPALLARTREAFDADTCAILLLDEETGELVARAAVGLEEEVEAGVRIPLGLGFAGRIAAERCAMVIEDVEHGEVLNPILREKGVKSLLGVPLLIGGEALGVLHVGTLYPRAFTVEDVELLQLVANRAAIGIEHARVLDAERRARKRLEELQSVTDVALGHLELDDLLAELMPRIRDVLRVDTAAVLLLDPDRRVLVPRAALGLEEEVGTVRVPVGRGFAGRVIADRRPIVLDDLEHADIINPLLREKGLATILGVPLVAYDDAIGVLHVGSLVPRVFTSDDTELLLLVAQRVALAIERTRVHERLIEIDQLKLNFVAVASHELRTPTTSIYGALATLRERELPPETRAVLEETLWEQTLRLRRLIEQLLDLSRLDSGAIHVHPQPIVLLSVLREIVAAASVGSRPDTVRLDVDANLAVIADPLVLDRVLSNLVGNACRHGEAPVTVRAEVNDRHLRIAVEDQGEGIADELAPRIFERFERGGGGEGSGLGLAIAKAYARAHGGDLVYEPRERGARFELVLPKLEARAGARS